MREYTEEFLAMLSLDVTLGSSAKCLSIFQPLDLRGWSPFGTAHQLDAVI